MSRMHKDARLKRNPSWLPVAGILVFSLLYSIAYLGMSNRWWFEDDPMLYAYAARIANPWAIFTDVSVVRQFTTGRAFVPMQIFSYWADVKLAGFSPSFAYGHQIFSFSVTLLLLYFVLVTFLEGDELAAFAISVIWALLPATAVVLQFLSTRHYLEGLLFALLSVYLVQRLRREDGGLPWAGQILVLLSISISMLYKEIYAAMLPLMFLGYASYFRRFRFALVIALQLCGYIAWRFATVGPALEYQMRFLTVTEYIRFLSKLPYTVSSNYAGYGIFAMVAVCAYWTSRRSSQGKGATLLFLGLAAASLVAILPVSFPLYNSIRTPDPWYRIVFLFHTIIVCFGGYFVLRSVPRGIQALLLVMVAAAMLTGVEKTRRLWTDLTSSAEREGKFYVDNPDKMLLSEQAAWWFIPGVHIMYKVPSPHYVLLKDWRPEKQLAAPLWRYRGGRFIAQ